MIKGSSKAVENESKEQKGGFVGKLLGILGASLLGNLEKLWKNTESKKPRMTKTNKEKLIYKSAHCVIVKQFRFIEKQEASRLLISLGLNTTLSKIQQLGDIIF